MTTVRKARQEVIDYIARVAANDDLPSKGETLRDAAHAAQALAELEELDLHLASERERGDE